MMAWYQIGYCHSVESDETIAIELAYNTNGRSATSISKRCGGAWTLVIQSSRARSTRSRSKSHE